MPQTLPHGSWPSPVDAALLASSNATVSDLTSDGEQLFWLQSRPDEGGRLAVMRRSADGVVAEVSPPDFNARTRVHEYGGGALAVGGGLVLAARWDDQRVHRIDPDTRTATPVTAQPAEPNGRRWAAMAPDPSGSWFAAVRETHGTDRPTGWPVDAADEARNEIVHVDVASGTETVLVSGRDFVAGPWLDPEGVRIAWLAWDHPEMPWDAAELWVADLGDGGTSLGEPVRVAGGLTPDGPHRATSVTDVAWHPDGSLLFTHDPHGFWNLHRWVDGHIQPEPLLPPGPLERGRPRWLQGGQRIAVLPDGGLPDGGLPGGGVATVAIDRGLAHVEVVGRGRLTDDSVTWVGDVVAAGSALALVHGGPGTPQSISFLDPVDGALEEVMATADVGVLADLAVDPEPIEFPTAGGTTAHALFLPPRNAAVEAPDGDLPPLVVMTHGGPTGAASPLLSVGRLYWTSRGFAVVDVNYRGSVGYGRDYRDALRDRWGIVDVEDVVAVVRHLSAQGLVDPQRVAIRGGSAGGYTTLMALCTTDLFGAGCSLFGVSDLAALARDTHKFESRYLDGLIGRWPQDEATYRERSPVHRTEGLATPMLILQGDEDAVVPPAQAEMMVEALAEKGITHAYVLFEGEQHGFRRAANIIAAIESELSFYGHVFGIATQPSVELPLRP